MEKERERESNKRAAGRPESEGKRKRAANRSLNERGDWRFNQHADVPGTDIPWLWSVEAGGAPVGGGGDRFPDKTRETERERLKETDGRLKREEKTAGSKGGRGDGRMEKWRDGERETVQLHPNWRGSWPIARSPAPCLGVGSP